MIMIRFLSFFLFLIVNIFCDDEIINLPGLTFTPNFKSYSGYLQVSESRFLHYWLVESQSNPNVDPLVLWFNGGPGCSSLDGLLSEHGPYLISEQGYLTSNPYSWNKIANVLYIEAPAGVGFSYDTTGDVTNEDNLVARQNYEALSQFLQRYPQFRSRQLWITGESYAGVYVPTLAAEVLRRGEFALQGVMVGNGITSYSLNDDSLVYFGKYHGLFGVVLWDELMQQCCPNHSAEDICYFSRRKSRACYDTTAKVNDIINTGLNVYNLYKPCYGGVTNGRAMSSSRDVLDSLNLFRSNPIVQTKRLLRRIKSPTGASRVAMTPPCTNSTAITTYLNNSLVRQALHIPARFDNVSFEVCNDQVYTAYQRTYHNLTSVYRFLFEHKVPRILVYNGDIDMACNFLGDEWFLDDMRLPLISNRTVWFYVDEDGTKQVGGYTKSWTNNLQFVTVRGSGHMVPQDKPASSYHMFRSVLFDQPL